MEFLIELFKVVIIGIVEGITEWLPVSSTGHMILIEEFLHLNVTAEFQEMFNVVIQLGAILAVVVLYFHKLWPFQRKVKGFQGFIKRDVWDLWMKVIIAVIPAAAIGIPLDDWFTEHFHNYQVVALMLIVYGVLFIVIENFNKKRTPAITDFSQMTWKMALAIGAFQVLSLIPGTSRSGSTILGALLLGNSRFIAAEFSFYLAIPVMFGASLLKLLKFGLAFTMAEGIILITGMIVAFVVSILAIKFLMSYIKTNDFKVFGYYRIVLGILVLGYFFFLG